MTRTLRRGLPERSNPASNRDGNRPTRVHPVRWPACVLGRLSPNNVLTEGGRFPLRRSSPRTLGVLGTGTETHMFGPATQG